MTSSFLNHQQARRREAMGVLGHCATADIAGYLDAVAVPAHEHLRQPENGLVMLRGRIGGDGAPFNLGEATVSRVPLYGLPAARSASATRWAVTARRRT